MDIFGRFRHSGEAPLDEASLTLAEADRRVLAERVAAGIMMGWVTGEEAIEIRALHEKKLQEIADLTVIPPINDADIPRA